MNTHTIKMKMRTGENERAVRKILNTIVKLEQEGNCCLNAIHHLALNRLRESTTTYRIEIFKKAIGNNSKRKHAALLLLPELINLPGAEETFATLLTSPDPETRCCTIQVIGLAQLKKLAPVLNRLWEKENDFPCRKQLVHALREITDEISLPQQQFNIP
jgi:hypothetical protein